MNENQPNLFFIGGMRCGSTSINFLLEQHPEIFMAPVKEPYFYTAEAARRGENTEGDPSGSEVAEPAGRYRDGEAYYGLFAEAGDVAWRGESSHYLYHASVIPTILSDCPEAHFLVVLRNPVDRIFSEYLRLCRIGEERRNFDSFVQEMLMRRGKTHELGPRLDKGLQGKHLAPWLSTVPTGNLKWILFDDFEKGPIDCIQSVFRWLGVDYGFTPEVVHTQRGGIQAGPNVDRIIRSRRFGARRLKKLIPRTSRKKIIDFMHSRTLVRPSLKDSTRAFLSDLYRNDVERLEGMIGRDLSLWLESKSTLPSGGC